MTDKGLENALTMAETLHNLVEPNPLDAGEVGINNETLATAQQVLATLDLSNTQSGAMFGTTQVMLLKELPTGAVSVDFSGEHTASIDINNNTVTINGVETTITDLRDRIAALGIRL